MASFWKIDQDCARHNLTKSKDEHSSLSLQIYKNINHPTKDYLFLATSYGVVVCHNAKTGDLIWEKEFSNGFYSSPILVDDKIYIIDKEGITHIFKADKEFVSLGEAPLGEGVVSTPAFMDGRVFIRADKNLYCIGNWF